MTRVRHVLGLLAAVSCASDPVPPTPQRLDAARLDSSSLDATQIADAGTAHDVLVGDALASDLGARSDAGDAALVDVGIGLDALPADTGWPIVEIGRVVLSQEADLSGGVEVVTYTASATFGRDVDGETGERCERTVEGICSTTRCTYPDALVPDPGPFPHAGDIVMSGGVATTTLSAGPDGSYPGVRGDGRLWFGTMRLRVVAAGDAVPAFDAQLRAPITTVLIAPAIPAPPGELVIAGGTGLGLQWTGTVGADVRVLISSTERSAGSRITRRVECAFPDGLGSARVPGHLLATIPSGSVGRIEVTSQDAHALSVSGWDIVVEARFTATSNNGGIARGRVRFR